MTFEEIGNNVISFLGRAECMRRYKTDDPEWIGALSQREKDNT